MADSIPKKRIRFTVEASLEEAERWQALVGPDGSVARYLRRLGNAEADRLERLQRGMEAMGAHSSQQRHP